MDIICRFCLSGTETLVDIFDDREQSAEEPSLAEVLNECVESKVKSEDKLPKNICLPCRLDARTAFNFKRRCEHSYKLLTLKVVKGDVDVNFDGFFDVLEYEEWELPKRVLDLNCIINIDARPKPDSGNNEEISVLKTHTEDQELKTVASAESLEQEDQSPHNENNNSISNRFPIRQSKLKSYIELVPNLQTDSSSADCDWSEELSGYTVSEAIGFAGRDKTGTGKTKQTERLQRAPT